MIDKLMKLKEGSKKMSDTEKDAKLSVLQEMKKMAEDSMGSKLKGLKKVTVAAGSTDDLEAGLEKAKEIVGSDALTETEETDELDETTETPEASEFSEMSEEEIEQKLAELMALKDKMKVKI